MEGSLEQPPVIFRGRRWTWRRAGSLGILLYAGASLLLQQGRSWSATGRSPLTWFVLAAVSFGLLGLIWTAISPARLEISPAGVRRVAAWRTRRWAWDEIGDFRVARYATTDAVGFNYAKAAKRNATYSQTLERACGSQGLLVTNMADPLEEIVGLLNRARVQWLGKPVSALPRAKQPGVVATGLGFAMVVLAGRVDRRLYWGVLVAAVALGAMASAVTRQWASALTWVMIIWLFVGRGRLRDIGRSPRWLVLAPIAAAVISFFAMRLGLSINMSFGVAGLALAGMMVALGFVRGTATSNKFGARPGGDLDDSASAFS
jgi:uncharacterized membrane protein YhaH (DUF805 family)